MESNKSPRALQKELDAIGGFDAKMTLRPCKSATLPRVDRPIIPRPNTSYHPIPAIKVFPKKQPPEEFNKVKVKGAFPVLPPISKKCAAPSLVKTSKRTTTSEDSLVKKGLPVVPPIQLKTTKDKTPGTVKSPPATPLSDATKQQIANLEDNDVFEVILPPSSSRCNTGSLEAQKGPANIPTGNTRKHNPKKENAEEVNMLSLNTPSKVSEKQKYRMCDVLSSQTQLSLEDFCLDFTPRQPIPAEIQEKLDSLDIASITVPFKPFEGNSQFYDAKERIQALVTPNMYEGRMESLTAEDVRFIQSRNEDSFLYHHFQQDFTDETLESPRYIPRTFLSPVEAAEEVDRESSPLVMYLTRTFLSPIEEVDRESCLSANKVVVDVKAVEEEKRGTPIKSFQQQKKTHQRKIDGIEQQDSQRKIEKVQGTNEIFLERLQTLGAKSNLEEMKLTNRLAVMKSELENTQKRADTAKQQLSQRQRELKEVRVTNRLLTEKQQKLQKEMEMVERELKKGKSKDKQLSNEVKRMSIDHEKLISQEDLIIQESQQIERKLKKIKSVNKKRKHFR
ncbi:uncharacterized protein LOC134231104 [Saccostrea cucullata]|uniref:uncharacterized protein LOC134231104 n=1 Tax=Saccostrea cuccullata TaxID=36930 RepID=UPI002ED32CFC